MLLASTRQESRLLLPYFVVIMSGIDSRLEIRLSYRATSASVFSRNVVKGIWCLWKS